ncbi:GAP family protein [Mycobacterium sp. SMC-2]|uniref:GAP family protein n=1 Tax=Mycobacterium sp. SMC-2 TaxID=2857058 RepID=UPI0021B26B3A|nr:GAP family protein [Mycobacterium sp. SMC-2]UXA04459.1 GAP family protein [Mycobacterium sp. SMC-2]
MWGSVLGLGILAALNPVRLGLALLMISRPRPGPNLLAYWVGGLTVCVPELLAPLMLLNFTSAFGSLGHGGTTKATSSTLPHIQIGLGVLGLSIAALMAVRFWTRQRSEVRASSDRSAARTPAPDTPIAIPRFLRRARDVSPEDRSGIRRPLHRAHSAWEKGSLWIAWVIGLASVPADGVLFILAIIVASRAAVATQVSASIAFVLLMYSVVEMILLGYVAAPARTQALLRQLHDWVRAYHRQILVAVFTVVGVSQLAQGMHVL